MNFREYKIGSRMFAVALGGSMCITLLLAEHRYCERRRDQHLDGQAIDRGL